MYLYGAGGHAKVIIDIIRDSGATISGVFDDNIEIGEIYGSKVFGLYNGQKLYEPIIISIGNNTIRAKIANRLNTKFGIAIHNTSIISSSIDIGEGTVVMQGSIIQADTKIGNHVIINTNASVDHDCIIEDFVHISPGAVLCGHVKIGEGTHIGAGSVITPGVTIGKWSKINAGAIITRDIPDFATVMLNQSIEVKTKS